jgi:hypothetical protein
MIFLLFCAISVLAVKNEAAIGWSENWAYLEDAAKIDAAPYCKLIGIDMCTLQKKKKKNKTNKRRKR